MSTCAQSVPGLVIALGIGVFLLLALAGVLVTLAVQRAGVKRVVHVPGTPEWEKTKSPCFRSSNCNMSSGHDGICNLEYP